MSLHPYKLLKRRNLVMSIGDSNNQEKLQIEKI